MGASTLITDYIGRGLAASRPASPNVPSGCSAFYVATDTGVVSVWNGSTWATVGGSSGANPTATASDTAVNGTATTFMKSDAAPAIQKASAAQFGLVKVDGTTVTASAGVISAAAATVAVPHPGLVSGVWYSRMLSTSTSSGSTTGLRLYATPIYIPAAATISAMALHVATAVASSHIEMGIYANSGGNPGALLLDAGQIDSSTTGTKTITGLSLAVSPGYIWVVCVSDLSVTSVNVYGTTNFDTFELGIDSALTNGIMGVIGTWGAYSTGNLPATFPSPTRTSSAVPIVAVQIA